MNSSCPRKNPSTPMCLMRLATNTAVREASLFQKLCIPRPSTKHTSSVQHLQIQAPDLPGGPSNLYSIFNSTSKPGVQKTMPKSWSLFILLKCWEAGLRPLARIAIIYCNTTLLLLDPWKTINIIGLYLSRPPTPQPLPPPTKKQECHPIVSWTTE